MDGWRAFYAFHRGKMNFTSEPLRSKMAERKRQEGNASHIASSAAHLSRILGALRSTHSTRFRQRMGPSVGHDWIGGATAHAPNDGTMACGCCNRAALGLRERILQRLAPRSQ